MTRFKFLQNNLLILLVLVLTMAGCASTIENKANLDEVVFTVNETTQGDIQQVLGLPAFSAINEDNQESIWSYTGRSRLVGIMYALPTHVSSTSYTVTSYTTSVVDVNKIPIDAVVSYVFDANKVLKEVIQHEGEQ